MKVMIFANRVTKEIVRDPVALFFGIVFPIVLLFLLSIINKNVPVEIYNISSLTPGIAVFSLSFMALFAAQIVSKDRSSSFLARLYTTPIQSRDFILGYTLPLIIISIVQSIVCFVFAIILGLKFTTTIFVTILLLLPMAIIFISIGLIVGTLLSEKAATAICGAGLTNVSAWLSGAWFSLDLVGGAFKDVAYMLPFAHGVDLAKAVLKGQYDAMYSHLWWVLGYSIVFSFIAIIVFRLKMRELQ